MRRRNEALSQGHIVGNNQLEYALYGIIKWCNKIRWRPYVVNTVYTKPFSRSLSLSLSLICLFPLSLAVSPLWLSLPFICLHLFLWLPLSLFLRLSILSLFCLFFLLSLITWVFKHVGWVNIVKVFGLQRKTLWLFFCFFLPIIIFFLLDFSKRVDGFSWNFQGW